jgi:hypothetical protein
MKKIITEFAKILLLSVIVSTFVSCSKAGEVHNSPVTVKIYGKEYIFKGVILQDETHPVWIMIPVDSTAPQPLTVTQEVKVGKTTQQQSVIILN